LCTLLCRSDRLEAIRDAFARPGQGFLLTISRRLDLFLVARLSDLAYSLNLGNRARTAGRSVCLPALRFAAYVDRGGASGGFEVKKGSQIRVALVLAVCLALSSGILSLATTPCPVVCDKQLDECQNEADAYFIICVAITKDIIGCAAEQAFMLVECGKMYALCLDACLTAGPGTAFPGGSGPVHIAPK
jgi:hypothetical protein